MLFLAGVEPTAFRLGGERSIQLSYRNLCHNIIKALRGKHKRNKEDLSTCSFVGKRTDSLCWGTKKDGPPQLDMYPEFWTH